MAPRKKAKLSNNDKATVRDNTSVLKTSKKTRRNRKGCLEIVQELPLDVSLQIFGHLHPRDLLNLAKTSKAFRAFFLNRDKSISIWKSSLRQVEGLPEKPGFISEPALAHFLFNSVCQNCGMFTTRRPIWAWFVRYCVKCTDVKSCRLQQVGDTYEDLKEVILEKPFELFDIYIASGRPLGFLVHHSQLEEFSRELKKIAEDDEGGRKAFLETQCRARQEERMARQQFATWFEGEERRRSAELDSLRHQRLQDIMDRLQHEDSEWLPEMQHFDHQYIRFAVDCVPLAHQPNRLTDRAWPKVLAALQEKMAALREYRLREQGRQ